MGHGKTLEEAIQRIVAKIRWHQEEERRLQALLLEKIAEAKARDSERKRC